MTVEMNTCTTDRTSRRDISGDMNSMKSVRHKRVAWMTILLSIPGVGGISLNMIGSRASPRALKSPRTMHWCFPRPLQREGMIIERFHPRNQIMSRYSIGMRWLGDPSFAICTRARGAGRYLVFPGSQHHDPRWENKHFPFSPGTQLMQ